MSNYSYANRYFVIYSRSTLSLKSTRIIVGALTLLQKVQVNGIAMRVLSNMNALVTDFLQ